MNPNPSHRPFRIAAVVLLATGLLSTTAQNRPAYEVGRIHGRVINPMGQLQNGGTVSLSTDGGNTLTYTFPVSESGEYSGQAAPGEYMVIYRAPDTPEDKAVDYVTGVQIANGDDVAQDIDMTRQEYMDRLSPEQRQQIDAMRAAMGSTGSENQSILTVNAGIHAANQDLQDINNARATAAQTLGDSASAADIDSAAAQIIETKYSEIEALMKKATAIRPSEPTLWMNLAHAQIGLREFEDAEANYKKALDLLSHAENVQPQLLGEGYAGLGEVYARSLMVDDANTAFNNAAKADPANAAVYLHDQALIFYQEKNAPAQVDAADKALKVDPNDAILYYIKAQGLALNAPLDPNTNHIVLSPDCTAAYRKYLELAPDGLHAAEVKEILQEKPDASILPPDQNKTGPNKN